MKKALMITILALISLSSLTILSLYFLGDRIVEIVLETQPDIKEPRPDEFSDSSGPAGINPQEADQSTDGSLPESTVIDVAAQYKENTDTGIGREDGKELPAVEKTGKGKGKKEDVAVRPEKIKEIKDQVSPQDKVSIAAMVLAKLKKEDISYLSGLIQDGLTNEEKESAKRVAAERFSGQELEKIKEYYYMYTEAENSQKKDGLE